ncbi:MAG: DHH family phosphoesterase [Candidatus Saccharibacteria bacterium]
MTSGSQFLDIDAYGGCVAYAELLQCQGKPAQAASSAPLNESITAMIRSWDAPLATDYQPQPDDTFTLIDVSDPEFFDPMVDMARITGVIDHHTGFEEYWQDRLGEKAAIDFIGAACTLVYEQWQQANRLSDISRLAARLLVAGILDNTLYFRSGVTSERDQAAYGELMKRADLPATWPAQYFTDCQAAIEADLPGALHSDTKIITESDVLPGRMGQLVIWNGKDLLARRREDIAAAYGEESDWLVSVVSIDENCNYFLAGSAVIQAKFAKLMNVEFREGLAVSDRLWLRKEILKRAQSIR